MFSFGEVCHFITDLIVNCVCVCVCVCLSVLSVCGCGKVSLPGLSCHDVTDRVFPYDLGFTVYLRRCYGRYGGNCR